MSMFAVSIRNQKGVYYREIKMYNHLTKAINDLSGNNNKYKLALKISLRQFLLLSEGVLKCVIVSDIKLNYCY
jgi:hypothetical protein